MVERQLEKVFTSIKKQYPVLTITGPRQSGKTTLAQKVFKNYDYVSLENPQNLSFAREDPVEFLKQFSGGVIIDEVQKEPKLLSYLQEIVDTQKKMGRYILAGSQQLDLMGGITQSLAGRTALIQLLPFSKHELSKAGIVLDSLEDYLHHGFYPAIYDRKIKSETFFANYIATYVERDVRSLLDVKDLSTFQLFLKMCAARVAGLMNMNSLSNDLAITHNTVKSWLSVLETGFIIFMLPSFQKNLGKRLIKSKKLYFFDPGLVCYLNEIRQVSMLRTHVYRGPLFENFIILEILKYFLNKGLRVNPYFYRDSHGNEIDLVLEYNDKLYAIEIKSAATIHSDFFTMLKKFEALLARPIEKVLIYGGDTSFTRSGVRVISWRDVEKVIRR